VTRVTRRQRSDEAVTICAVAVRAQVRYGVRNYLLALTMKHLFASREPHF